METGAVWKCPRSVITPGLVGSKSRYNYCRPSTNVIFRNQFRYLHELTHINFAIRFSSASSRTDPIGVWRGRIQNWMHYPWWRPTIWRDVAYLSSNNDFCRQNIWHSVFVSVTCWFGNYDHFLCSFTIKSLVFYFWIVTSRVVQEVLGKVSGYHPQPERWEEISITEHCRWLRSLKIDLLNAWIWITFERSKIFLREAGDVYRKMPAAIKTSLLFLPRSACLRFAFRSLNPDLLEVKDKDSESDPKLKTRLLNRRIGCEDQIKAESSQACTAAGGFWKAYRCVSCSPYQRSWEKSMTGIFTRERSTNFKLSISDHESVRQDIKRHTWNLPPPDCEKAQWLAAFLYCLFRMVMSCRTGFGKITIIWGLIIFFLVWLLPFLF